MRGRVIAALLASSMAACTAPLEVTHVLTGPPLPARADDAPMPVYVNEVPGRPYREVAQIRVRTTGADATLRTVVAAAAQDAREIGADAIIIDARRHYHSVQVHVGCDERSYVDPEWRLNARATAIRFVRDGEASPEPAPTGPTRRADPCR